MKIAIPVDNNSLDTNVCISFGRTPYYMIYDTDKKESSFIENTAANQAGGAGIKAAQIVVDSGAEILLTPRCGENAADVIAAGGIKMYKSIEGKAEDNIAAFMAGRLNPLKEIHSGFHGHGDK